MNKLVIYSIILAITAPMTKRNPGKSGKEEMDGILAALRKNPWKELCDMPVTEVKDYSTGLDGLPKSNVLSFCGRDSR